MAGPGITLVRHVMDEGKNSIGQDTGALVYDGRFVLKVSRDKMEAHLIVKDELGLKSVDMARLKNEIQEAGVAYGFLPVPEDLGANVFAVSRGRRAVNGEAGKIKMHVSASVVRKPKVDPATGKVDFHSLGSIVNVNKGQILMEKIPPTPGVAGTNVLGAEIPAKPGKDCKMKSGPGIEVDESDTLARATLDGKFVVVDGRPGVYGEHQHNGNVDVEVGNLVFGGSLLTVKGEVLPGFAVKCKGRVEIGAGVNNALVMAGDEIIIKGGVVGEDAEVRGIGDLTVDFVENGPVLETRGDLYLRDYLLQSDTRVAGSIFGRENGAIIGGTTVCGGSIHVKDLGGDAEVVTDVTVGMKPDLAARKERLDEAFPLWSGRMNEVLKTVTGLQKIKKEQGRNFPPERQEKLEKYNAAMPKIMERVEKLQNMMSALEEEIDQAINESVYVYGTLYPGVTVRIGPGIRTVANTESGMVIHFDLDTRQIHIRKMTPEEVDAGPGV